MIKKSLKGSNLDFDELGSDNIANLFIPEAMKTASKFHFIRPVSPAITY